MIGLQLYTVRDHLNTPEEAEKTFQRIREIGYDTVQFGNTGFAEPERIKELLNENSFSVYGSGIRLYEKFADDVEEFIKLQKIIGIKDVCFNMPPEMRISKEGYLKFISEANNYSRIFGEHGIRIFYHNHNFEFVKFDGTLGMDYLIDGLDPEKVDFEIDTYWVQAGGADPAQWIRKLKGRMKAVHFKDMSIDLERKQHFAEVGEGNMNWNEIIKACQESGIEIYCVEQDFCQRDSLESAEISYKNMKKMGL